jgi:diguanylate cyclase (GGDEF)-like protein/PAS domain S-box-containing protein
MRALRRTERITRVMSGNVGLEQLFGAVLPELRAVVDVDTVRLLVVEPGRQCLVPRFALGAKFDEGDRIPFGAGFAGRIAAERVAFVVEDVAHFPIESAGLRRSKLASLAGVPIMDDEVLGVLHVGTRRPRRFKAEDLELLVLVADRLALALRQSEVETELRRTQAIAQSVLDTAADAILTYDADGGIRTANRSVERLFGWRAEELVGHSLTELVPEASGAVLAPAQDRLPHDTIAVEALRRDGSTTAADLTVSEVETNADGRLFTAILRDASARRASEARLRHEALHDVLTGLPNRALFREHLERSLARQGRDELQVAVMFLDLDRFKQVNDTLGHAAGDELLRQVAARLGSTVRPGDTVGRLSGDEFAVLLPRLGGPHAATAFAARITACFETPFRLEGREVEVGTSVGIALRDGTGANVEEVLREADAAMYRDKQRRRAAPA